jgi:hyperosmotically inducible periplasmic protein
MRTAKRAAAIFATIAIVCGLSQLGAALTVNENGTPDTNDQKIQAELTKSLDKVQFKSVKVAVNSGIVTLTGVVDLYAYKADAAKRAHHIMDALAVRNNLSVGGAHVSDEELQQKLVRKLEYDRVGYGTTTFNAIGVKVLNGVVTLGGNAYGPADKDSAISVASYTPGVQDVVDEIAVDPVSSMDDGIRIAVARAVYGHSSLNRYAINPARPIRISVQHGHVTLFGLVDGAADRDMAYLKANSVPGVFTVTNQLQVSNAVSERDR